MRGGARSRAKGDRYLVVAGDPPLRLPYHGNADLDDGRCRRFTTAVVGVHGMARDAVALLTTLRAARRLARAAIHRHVPTLLAAPAFPAKRDAREGALPPDVPCWSVQGWKEGNRSAPREGGHERLPRLSSFAALDAFLARLADRRRYPALRRVALVGHSAGGQFVQRYALASELPDRLAAAGVEVVHVVANPASYLYPDDRRPDGAGRFARPASLAADCSDWNSYKYGLEMPNAYLAGTARGRLLERLRCRRVVYLLGTADDDPAHPELDTSCAARLQGRHRLERGLLYHAYLETLLGQEDARRHHSLELVPGVGHDARGMLTAAPALCHLFDVGPSGTPAGPPG